MYPEFLERRILAAGTLVTMLFATTAGLAQEDASEEVAEAELEELGERALNLICEELDRLNALQ